MGHMRKKCPNHKVDAVKPPARAFHMTEEEARCEDKVIIGPFSVNDFPVMVLFDSGASISFI